MALVNKVFERRKIDLTGPDGNAFFLIGQAMSWGKQIDNHFGENRTPAIKEQMESGDYFNLVAVFELHFGSICDLEMEDPLLHEVKRRVEGMKASNNVSWDLEKMGF